MSKVPRPIGDFERSLDRRSLVRGRLDTRRQLVEPVDAGSIRVGVQVADEVEALLGSLYMPEAAEAWLHGHNSHLAGARPIDLLELNEFSDVLDALNAEIQGGMH